jgi:hypothetical protein
MSYFLGFLPLFLLQIFTLFFLEFFSFFPVTCHRVVVVAFSCQIILSTTYHSYDHMSAAAACVMVGQCCANYPGLF